MNKTVLTQMATLAASSLLAFSAFANAHKEAPAMAASGTMTKQQSKMGDCATANKGKKGDAYKASMKTCLADKPMTQQQKMSACSKENKGKKGDEYKGAMKTCLAA